jgi:hypothetical protein
VPVFGNRDLAKAAASILGDEAMHWPILANALRRADGSDRRSSPNRHAQRAVQRARGLRGPRSVACVFRAWRGSRCESG